MLTAECLLKMRLAKNIVLFLSICLFVGLIYISFFNVYQTDDYIFSYQTRKLGLLGSMESLYLKWGGRYFGYSLNTLNPVSYDNFGILPKVYPVFLITSLIAVFTLNFSYYFKYSFWKALSNSFLLFFFYTVLLIVLPEHYFWITGMNIYLLPVILGGILLYFLGKYHQSLHKKWYYLSLGLIIILMGSNEIIALLLEGLLIFYYFQNKAKDRLFLVILGGVFLLVSFLAPGNFIRLNVTSDSFFIKWIKRIGLFGANEIFIITKIIIVIPLFIKIFESEIATIYQKIDIKKSFILYGISLLSVFFLAYITNAIGRQFENIIFYSLIMFSLSAFLYKEKVKKLWWVSLLLLFVPKMEFFPKKYTGFNISYNLNNFCKEIFITDLKGYEIEVNQRIEKIKNTKNDTLTLERIKNVPKILYFDELSTKSEEKKYVNDQLEKYFNKKTINVKE